MMSGEAVMRLNRESPVPLYHQLKEAFKRQIEQGILKPHDRLPAERELEEFYSISRMTARRALSELEAEGYIYRQQGKGSFVAEPKLRQGLLKLTSFTDDMRQRGMTPGARVLDIKLIDDEDKLRQKFRAERGERFVRIQRIRLANGEPMALETSFIRHKFCPGLEKFDFTDRSLYKTLREEYNLYLSYADQTIEVKLADEYEEELLHVRQGAPMWVMERTTYLEDNETVIEYVHSIYRGDRYKLYAKLDVNQRRLTRNAA
jgi:GntR family transcriptional regulator